MTDPRYPIGTRGSNAVHRYNPPTPTLQYVCDLKRHLICLPYSVANLHRMADALAIGRHWFHLRGTTYSHYDIPKRRIAEIVARCRVVSTKELIRLIRETVSQHVRLSVGVGYQGECE